ncbi:hypothetical protein FBU30_001498 [Linnemannia zychae]|nr:hypothetical protein FBU30_001498 [Linnemannia zychae]
MNPPPSVIALGIPEMLTRIGSSFYLRLEGHKEFESQQEANILKIKSLVAFVHVSRLWYTVFHPILWYSYDSSITDQFTFHSISVNENLFRTFTAMSPLNCYFSYTQLTELMLLKLEAGSGGEKQWYEQSLVESNPGLKRLYWVGDEFQSLDPKHLCLLKSLQDLTLCRWEYDGDDFFDVLAPMARTLTKLSLREMENLDFSPRVDDLQFPVLEYIMINPVTGGSILPSTLQYLFLACPRLKTLGFGLYGWHEFEETKELALGLRKYCPELQDLTLDCDRSLNMSDENFLLEVSPKSFFIQNCSSSGLKRLSIIESPWSSDLALAIISHSTTLIELHFTWKTIYPSDPVGGSQTLVNIMGQCQNLERLDAVEIPWKHRTIILDTWHANRSTWTTHSRLETFCFGFKESGYNWTTKDDDDEEISKISYENPVMGWRKHGNVPEIRYGRYTSYGSRIEPVVSDKVLRRLFELFEGENSMRQLVVDGGIYSRSSIPPLPLRPYSYAHACYR